MSSTTLALLGATGGAGTTRTTLELATILAADGADVAVLDAAYDTQGLARHLPGRLTPDLTSLVTDETDRPLSEGFVSFDPMVGDPDVLAPGATDGADAADASPPDPGDASPPDPGRVACCPAHAPFERLARAKTTDAAQALERRVDEAGETFDYVLVDTPPLGSNPAVAAATAADRVAVVAPTTPHGLSAVQTARGRLQDVGTAADVVVGVAHRGSDAADDATTDTDVLVPELAADVPACLGTAAGLEAFAEVASVTVDRSIGLVPTDRSVLDRMQSLR